MALSSGLFHRAGLAVVQADRHQLSTVVPLVGRLRQIQALETLQAHEHRALGLGECRGQRCLAHARVAFQQQGPLQLAR